MRYLIYLRLRIPLITSSLNIPPAIYYIYKTERLLPLPPNMLLKNILAAFTITGLAAASPAGDIEARSSTPCATGTPFCCATAFSLSIFFIQGVGSNCQPGKAILSSFRENTILISHPRHCKEWSFIMYW